MKYNHLGIPTTGRFEGEIDLPHLKMTVSDHEDNPFGIQWQRYWADASYPDLVKNMIVETHDPKWSRKFEDEAALVVAALGPAAIAIHHIGSTAIPEIFAKPIIDMLVEAISVEAIDERAASLEAMASSGEAMPDRHINHLRVYQKRGGRWLIVSHLISQAQEKR